MEWFGKALQASSCGTMFLVGKGSPGRVQRYWEPSAPWVLHKSQAIHHSSSHREASSSKHVVTERSLAPDLSLFSKWCSSKLQEKFWVVFSPSSYSNWWHKSWQPRKRWFPDQDTKQWTSATRWSNFYNLMERESEMIARRLIGSGCACFPTSSK